MKINRPTDFEPFTSGVCDIYRGDDPPCLLHHFRYQDRVVGVKRYFEARACQDEVNALIRIPQSREVLPRDKVVLLGTNDEYEVIQAQHHDDTNPPTTDLSLQTMAVKWG